MLRAVPLLCLLAACGRLGFDSGDDTPAIDAPGIADASNGTSDGPDAPPAMIQHTQATAVSSTTGPQTLTLSVPSTPGSLLVIAIVANDVSSLTLPNGWMIATSVLTSGACAAA